MQCSSEAPCTQSLISCSHLAAPARANCLKPSLRRLAGEVRVRVWLPVLFRFQ